MCEIVLGAVMLLELLHGLSEFRGLFAKFTPAVVANGHVYLGSQSKALRVYGLFSEIISWKLRFFVPVDTTGSGVLAKVLEHYPVVRVVDRTVA